MLWLGALQHPLRTSLGRRPRVPGVEILDLSAEFAAGESSGPGLTALAAVGTIVLGTVPLIIAAVKVFTRQPPLSDLAAAAGSVELGEATRNLARDAYSTAVHDQAARALRPVWIVVLQGVSNAVAWLLLVAATGMLVFVVAEPRSVSLLATPILVTWGLAVAAISGAVVGVSAELRFRAKLRTAPRQGFRKAVTIMATDATTISINVPITSGATSE